LLVLKVGPSGAHTCSRPRFLSYRKHLVGLVEDKHLHRVGLEDPTLDHVVDTAGGTDHDLRAIMKSLHVLTDAGAADAGMAINVHVVTNGNDNLLDLLGKFTSGSQDEGLALLEVLVDLLEDRDREGGSLASAGLGLGNDIVGWKGGKTVSIQD